jgi:hypothetical protein
MTSRSAVLIVFPVLVLGSMFSKAEDQKTIADVRCVLVGVQLSTDENQAKKLAGTMLTLYYTGKLDGSTPHLDLVAALTKEAAKMSGIDYRVEAERCGKALSAKAQQLTQLGKEILQGNAQGGH